MSTGKRGTFSYTIDVTSAPEHKPNAKNIIDFKAYEADQESEAELEKLKRAFPKKGHRKFPTKTESFFEYNSKPAPNARMNAESYIDAVKKTGYCRLSHGHDETFIGSDYEALVKLLPTPRKSREPTVTSDKEYDADSESDGQT